MDFNVDLDPQTVINGLFLLLSVAGGWILKSVSQTLSDLQRSDADLARKVQAIEVLVAGDYVKRDEMHAEINKLGDALFKRFDRLEDKLDGKADKT